MNIRQLSEKIEKDTLSPYAQLSVNTKGRQHPDEDCELRTEYQRDRDRIIHSKSFRRLKHKTQVFITPQGDHYRTRLTHTLEVSQIARTITRALRLNEDLVEAMSLGHDLGHTPFGHEGERVLNNLSSEGFCHNEQSLRIVDVLENSKGLNLTYEVRDGIVNHNGDNEASTLEGKILKFADRIAYINHDIDDSIRGGLLSDDMLPERCVKILGKTNSLRIDTMIHDIVNTSLNKDNISMSDEVGEAMLLLRKFLFENVYNSPSKIEEEKKAAHILEAMYTYFCKNPDKLPDEYKEFLNIYSIERVVCDYIAGMSDQYAIYIYRSMFIPKSWNVL